MVEWWRSMELKESFWLGIDALKTHKLRSLLTTLGIIIGITVFIGIVSLITGLDNKIRGELSAIGSDVIYVQKFPWVHTGGSWWEYRGRKNLTLEDAEAIDRLCPDVEEVGASEWQHATVKYRDKKVENVSVEGTVPIWQRIGSHWTETGRFLTDGDLDRRRQVCVIGYDIVDGLFEEEDPLDQWIKLGGDKFLVVGVLEQKGKIFGNSRDNTVIIPVTTFQKFYGKRRSLTIMALPRGDKDRAIDQMRGVLRRRRGVAWGEPDDFSINTQDLLMDTYNKVTGATKAVMVGITILSLGIGGIGIMNIMLVSVTERTREIGIRKAVGARKSDILQQFLLEAVVIAGLGGVIGIGIGLSAAKLISMAANLPAAIPIWLVLVGLGVSCGVGLFFGIFPSMKAARLDPIEALRYE
jgi:putative ABC transport system permease protein